MKIKKLVAARRISQAFFLALFIYILWSTTYPLKGILPPGTFFKIDPLVMILTAISERVIIPGMLLAVAMLVLALIFGRFFCGWVCPLGTAIDGAGALIKKTRRENDKINNRLHPVKSYIFGIMLIAAVFGIQSAWLLDPTVIMARFTSLNLMPFVTGLVNIVFIILINVMGMGGAITDLYHSLKSSFLGVHIYYFANSGIIFLVFAAVMAMTLITKRFWCRAICPLGAVYSLVSRFALLRRTVTKCVLCASCKSPCRMGAIRDDMSSKKSECILCMDCVYNCPLHSTGFAWPAPSAKAEEVKDRAGGKTISRKSFLLMLASPLILLGLGPETAAESAGEEEEEARGGDIIRPPAALKEKDFVDRCIRCGNCMKVCPTNGLQPVMFEAGYAAVWTPRLIPETGYCEYECTLCGKTCPTGAIRQLTVAEKLKTKLGTARIDRSICIPWSQNKQCIVCEEQCPVYQKAIKLEEHIVDGVKILRPYVDPELCVGCGTCQNKCPVRPVRAIRVSSSESYRPQKYP